MTTPNPPNPGPPPDLSLYEDATDLARPRAGIYVLLHQGSPVYVGKTRELALDLYYAKHQGKLFDQVKFLPCSKSDALRLRQLLIAKLSPLYNKNLRGSPPHDRSQSQDRELPRLDFLLDL